MLASAVVGLSIGRVVAVLAVVVGVPLGGIVGLALVGRSLAEAEVAEGTLVPQSVARARMLEEVRRFEAMPPAAHIAEARAALARGYDPTLGLGGDGRAARHHLRAVPETSPEHAEALAIEAELQRRRLAVRDVAASRLREALARDDGADEAARVEVARAVDALARYGLHGVFAEGPSHAALQFRHRMCDAEFLERVAPRSNDARLRARGFTAVRCANGRAARDLAAR